ncbi:MAG TPA: diacylglycerol kinase family protein [Chloroflexia bacterium]|nr:diacylglycerol kinase family protein [Chloroflexia bacterium]
MDKSPLDGWVMVICNPISGAGHGLTILKSVRRTLDHAEVTYSHEVSSGRGDVARLARAAVLSGCSTVVVIGGDGTFFEAVNGVVGPIDPEAAQGGAANGVAVGLVQAGRGSDFGRSAGVPSDVDAACARLVAGRTTLLDLGHVSYRSFEGEERRRFFANAAGLGFDAEVAFRANAGSRRLGGTIPYLSSLLRTLVTYHNKSLDFSFDGGEVAHARANSFVVANGQYFGGGMKIAPAASLSDGLFDITMLGDLGKVDLVRNVPRVYDGSHITHPKVSTARSHTVQIESDERVLLQADGEVLGLAPAQFTIVPAALRMIV